MKLLNEALVWLKPLMRQDGLRSRFVVGECHKTNSAPQRVDAGTLAGMAKVLQRRLCGYEQSEAGHDTTPFSFVFLAVAHGIGLYTQAAHRGNVKVKLRHAIMPTSNLEMRLQTTPSHEVCVAIAEMAALPMVQALPRCYRRASCQAAKSDALQRASSEGTFSTKARSSQIPVHSELSSWQAITVFVGGAQGMAGSWLSA